MWLPKLQCGVSKKTSERCLEWIASGLQSGFVREKQKSGLDFSRDLLIVGLDFFFLECACTNADCAAFLYSCWYAFPSVTYLCGGDATALLKVFIFYWKDASSREGNLKIYSSQGLSREKQLGLYSADVFLKHISSYGRDIDLCFCPAVSQQFLTLPGLSSSKHKRQASPPHLPLEKWLFLAQMWWCLLRILVLGRLRWENSLEFKARVRPSLKKPRSKNSNKQTNKSKNTPAHFS